MKNTGTQKGQEEEQDGAVFRDRHVGEVGADGGGRAGEGKNKLRRNKEVP